MIKSVIQDVLVFGAILVILLIGFEFSRYRRKTDVSEKTEYERELKSYLGCMEIWKCDDGTYEVRTDYVIHGKYNSLMDARINRTNWAIQVAKTVSIDLKKLPECGKKIE